MREAITLGAGVLPRRDWVDIRPEVVKAILRTAFSPPSEHASALIATLPAHLSDSLVEHPTLNGLRGPEGMKALQNWRGELARVAMVDQPSACVHCHHAQESGWPGLVGCALPGGLIATQECSTAPVVKGPAVGQNGKVEFAARLLPLTSIGGASFQAGGDVRPDSVK